MELMAIRTQMFRKAQFDPKILWVGKLDIFNKCPISFWTHYPKKLPPLHDTLVFVEHTRTHAFSCCTYIRHYFEKIQHKHPAIHSNHTP